MLISGILRVTEGQQRHTGHHPGVSLGKDPRPLGVREHRVALQRDASQEVASRRRIRDVTSGRLRPG